MGIYKDQPAILAFLSGEDRSLVINKYFRVQRQFFVKDSVEFEVRYIREVSSDKYCVSHVLQYLRKPKKSDAQVELDAYRLVYKPGRCFR